MLKSSKKAYLRDRGVLLVYLYEEPLVLSLVVGGSGNNFNTTRTLTHYIDLKTHWHRRKVKRTAIAVKGILKIIHSFTTTSMNIAKA